MKVVDADSHFFEPLGWFETEFPALAAKVAPFNLLEMVLGAVLPSDDFVPNLPPERRPDPLDVIPGFLRPLLQRLSQKPRTALECRQILLDSAEPGMDALGFLWREQGASDAGERVKFLDSHGIDFQFLNPSAPGSNAHLRAAKTGDTQLERQCLYAWNAWATERLSGHSNRLSAVVQLDLREVSSAMAEMRRARRLGSRAFNPRCEPIAGKSLAHPDFEPVWAAAEDLGMAVMLHIGTGRPNISPGWLNDGSGHIFNYLNLCKSQEHQTPELAIGSLILGGVLERHPRLAVLACEFGVSWLPHWLEVMDGASFTLSADFRPADMPTLPRLPSEYVARQVFVTALPHQKLNPTLTLVPSAIQFGTDYPHPEGSANAKAVFDAQLAGFSESVRGDFYGDRLAPLIGLN
jgi:uncharacterized protein